MKKIIMTLLLVTVLALGAVGLVGCDFTGVFDPATPDNFESDEQVFGFSAASAATLISAMNDGSAAKTVSAQKLALAAGNEVTDEATIAELNEYMLLVESLLADGAFGFRHEQSDLEGYTDKLSVSYVDLTGETISYEMYYNETIVREEVDRDDDDDFDDRDDDDDRDDGQEVETLGVIEGILRVDGTDYPMKGVSESSTEGNESENGHSLVVTLSDTSYLRVEQEIETENNEQEQEYVYSVYENNLLVEQSTFSFEQEHDETEIELEHRVRNEAGKMDVSRFSFEKETERGEEVIVIRVGGNSGNGATYTVNVTDNGDGTSSYVYTDASGNQHRYGRR